MIMAGPTVEMKVIGPEEARVMLERNAPYRQLHPRLVKQLEGAMLRGEWVFNGDTIRISEDGWLLEGQHRLAAIVASETEQEMLVVSGLSSAAQETMMDYGALTPEEHDWLLQFCHAGREQKSIVFICAMIVGAVVWLYGSQIAGFLFG